MQFDRNSINQSLNRIEKHNQNYKECEVEKQEVNFVVFNGKLMVKRAELQCFETKRHNLKCIIKGVNSNGFDYSRDNFHTILPN